MLLPEMTTTELTIAEAAIVEWQQWRADIPGKPEIVRALGQGRSNRSYLLQAGEAFMVLRINSNDEQLPGIDRRREASIWQVVTEVGIAPPLLFADQRYLVSSYVADGSGTSDVAGESTTGSKSTESIDAGLNRIGLTKAGLAEEVFSLIEKCHAIEIETDQLDYARHIQTYWSKIERTGLEQNSFEQSGIAQSGNPIIQALIKQRLPMQESLQALSELQHAPVLCHHDLVVANFVGTPRRLYLIDWEYAAKGMAVMDYAALAVEWGFSDASICTRTNVRPDSLVMAKNLYRYMCNLWQAAQGEP